MVRGGEEGMWMGGVVGAVRGGCLRDHGRHAREPRRREELRQLQDVAEQGGGLVAEHLLAGRRDIRVPADAAWGEDEG